MVVVVVVALLLLLLLLLVHSMHIIQWKVQHAYGGFVSVSKFKMAQKGRRRFFLEGNGRPVPLLSGTARPAPQPYLKRIAPGNTSGAAAISSHVLV